VLLALTPLLGGCVTTQQRNERAKLAAERLLEGRKALRLGDRSPDVRVTRVSLIRARRASAFVVELSNTGARAVADLPLEVGVAHGGRRQVLNRRRGLGYFARHVASIAPRGRARWVFVTRRPIPRGARGFAVAGTPDAALPGRPQALPAVSSSIAPGRTPRVTIRNGRIPQYGLPVYAFARRGGRYVAAGRAAVEHVGTAGTATVQISLVGARSGATLESEALPSIFR
jgi:hypothetical protein